MQTRIAGVDLGKAAIKLAVLVRDESGKLRVESTEEVTHEGEPMRAFAEWYRRENIAECAALGATGLYCGELAAPVCASLPEDACLEAALALRPDLVGPLNLVSVGARGYSVLTRDARGRIRQVENDKCSAGTGETIVKNAARFGLRVEAADSLALGASQGIPITARCSVFAKSEMTHFGNQGRPRDQLFRGYFDSIARYVAALLGRAQVDGPVYLIGGGTRIRTLRVCLQEHLGVPVEVPDQALFFEACGAARIAADQIGTQPMAALPSDPATLIKSKAVRVAVREPAKHFSHRVTVMQPVAVSADAASGPCVLGLDLGSTGSKAVLTSAATGKPVLDVYDRTRGNPVEAAQRLVRALLETETPDVRAIGVTGSGREAVATVLRAAYPDLADRISVVNEIVAHATAAIRCDEKHGESLTVVEIGGQDAKLIQIAGGQIIESDMNKACSAGTGSFLEEQAVFYGVSDIALFNEMAESATRPPDLGQMCTVFVAEAAAEAESAGFSVPDIFAGFQYSVIHNYLNRVMGQRTFGERIFFQGKPASGASLAWTLAAVTGREVTVPPNPGAMGAWGIGLCAREELGQALLSDPRRFQLDTFLSAEIAERGEMRCQDKACATLCNIEKTTVSVLGQRRQVFSGGACPKFEISTAARPKLDAQAPSGFDERATLLAQYAKDQPGERTVGIPEVGTLTGFMPWAVTFLAELGLGVRVLRSDGHSLQHGEELSYAYDACAPVKVAHAIADADVDLLFIPKVLEVAAPEDSGRKTCANEQAIPDVVAAALRARGRNVRMVAPVLSLADGYTQPRLVLALQKAALELGVKITGVAAAAERAGRAQSEYEAKLLEIGQRTLDYGRATKTPVVVVCGSLHVFLDRAINAGIPSILRQNGVLALPMDCLPVPTSVDRLPRVAWADLNHALRVSIAARERGGVFPLLLTSFGCGPASFGEQIFEMLMRGYPHTALETDGHGGNAGYVTRVQSFLHGVRRYGNSPSPLPLERLRHLDPAGKPGKSDLKNTKLVVLPIGDRLGELAAATYRSAGYDAVSAGPTSASGLAHGRRDCSGKECLPYQMIWGSFREHLENHPPDKRTLLVQVAGQGACRNCMFSIKDSMSLEHMGLSERVQMRHFGAEREGGGVFFGKYWSSVVAWDILNQLAAYHRPAERIGGEVDALYRRYCDELVIMAGKPGKSGLAGLLRVTKTRDDYLSLVERAALEFAELARQTERWLPTVLLTGDIYVRVDEFSSDFLARRLNERGLRVILDPVAMLVEYLVEERSAELLGLPTDYLENAVTRTIMRRARRKLYERVIPHHKWLPMPDVPGALRAGAPILGRFPHSEAPITVGTVMQAIDDKICDGIVVAAPWGCSPSLITESLLRHQRELPTLFVYADGTPLDERRLHGFAHRLRSVTAQRNAEAVANAGE